MADAIDISCPFCLVGLRVKLPATQVRCPNCNNSITVPEVGCHAAPPSIPRGAVSCRHCGHVGAARRHTTAAAWGMFLAIVLVGIFLWWPLLILFWLPLLLPHSHTCWNCGLRLD